MRRNIGTIAKNTRKRPFQIIHSNKVWPKNTSILIASIYVYMKGCKVQNTGMIMYANPKEIQMSPTFPNIHPTKNTKSKELKLFNIWRGTQGDEADVPATKLSFTYRISTLLLPLQLQLCRHISKGIIFWYPRARTTASRNPVRERQLCSGDVGFVTWRSSS